VFIGRLQAIHLQYLSSLLTPTLGHTSGTNPSRDPLANSSLLGAPDRTGIVDAIMFMGDAAAAAADHADQCI